MLGLPVAQAGVGDSSPAHSDDQASAPSRDDRPIAVLVHGFASQPEMWSGAAPALAEAGFLPLPIAWEPQEGMGIAESAEEVLLPRIARALRSVGRSPTTPFHAVGHSTGGLVLRWLMEQAPEPQRPAVLSLTMLSTPNQGARTGVARFACDFFRQPWRSLGCELIPGSPGLAALGTTVPPDSPPYLAVGVETLPNLLIAPPFDGDGDGEAHSHDNAVMAESPWLEGATFRIWRGQATRSHFTVACSSVVVGWMIDFMHGQAVPPQAPGAQPSEDLCHD